MIRRAAALSLLAACAPAAPEPAAPIPSTAPVAAPPAQPARWRFAARPQAAAELRLPGGGTLQVGGGRRWLLDATGAPRDAESIAPVDLVDARAASAGPPGAVVLLGRDGSVHAADEPLGRARAQGAAPAEGRAGGALFQLGARAVVGVTPEGVVLRSMDDGATWSRAPLGLRPGERVHRLATDRKGHVAVLLAPQRLLVSTDDGATFARLPLTRLSAGDLARDAADALWLEGYAHPPGGVARARITFGAGAPSLALGDAAAPLATAKQTPDEPRWLVSGGSVLRFTHPKEPARGLQVEVSKPGGGDSFGAPQLLTKELDPWLEASVSGDRAAILVLPRTRNVVEVFESPSRGAPFVVAGRFGRVDDDPSLLTAGPGGWLFLRRVCRLDQPGVPCGHHVRVAGEWKMLAGNLHVGAVVAGPGRALLWDGRRKRLFELPYDATEPRETDVPLDHVRALGVAADGALVALLGSPARMVRVVDGVAQPPRYLPVEPASASLAGARGLVVERGGRGRAFETADGGAHWLPLGALGPLGPPVCGDAGCSFDRALRLGWDLPALAASADPAPAAPPAAPAPRAARSRPTALECTFDPTKWKRSWGLPGEGLGLRGDTRWLDAVTEVVGVGAKAVAQDRTIHLAGGGAPKVEPLPVPFRFPGTSPQVIGDWGLARALLTFGPKVDGAYGPVDVQLAWVDALTGRSGHTRIAKVEPFRVGRSSFDGVFEVVEGGVLFGPDGVPGLRLVAFDGKVQKIPRPPPAGAPYRAAVRAGKALVLGAFDGETVFLARTSDLGKTWTLVSWWIGSPSELTVLGGQPALLVHPPHDRDPATEPLAVIPIGDLSSGDVPDGLAAPPLDWLSGCDPKAATGARWEHAYGLGVLRVTVSDGKERVELPTGRRASRGLPGGGRCTAVVAAEGQGYWALVAPHDLRNGHLLRRGKGDSMEWAPLSCARP